MTTAGRRDGTSKRASLLSRPMVMVLVASFGAMSSFYLLLSALPVYAARTGAGDVGAGLTTGVMMAATVVTELGMPRLLARYGYRVAMAAGLGLLGVPALVLLAGAGLPLVLAVAAARGAGLAIVVVLGTALVAELVPAGRRGEGLGLYGIAVGIPSVLGLPLGLWLGLNVGFGPVFAAAGATALVALVALPALPGRPAREDGVPVAKVLGGLRGLGLARPAVIFAATTFAAGAVVTFLPLAVPAGAAQTATVALLVQSLVAPVARWWAGRFGDRHGPSVLLVPAVLVTAAGTATLFRADETAVLIVGMVLFGAGFGAAQNVTLALMFARVEAGEFGRVSALWNLAFDSGLGLGAFGFGLVVGLTGYPWGFLLVAAVVTATLGLAYADRRSAGRAHRERRGT